VGGFTSFFAGGLIFGAGRETLTAFLAGAGLFPAEGFGAGFLTALAGAGFFSAETFGAGFLADWAGAFFTAFCGAGFDFKADALGEFLD